MYRFGISSGLIRNYCRNPDPVAAPYCYTMDPNVRWEYCNLTQCSDAEGTAVSPGNVTPVPSLEALSEQGKEPVARRLHVCTRFPVVRQLSMVHGCSSVDWVLPCRRKPACTLWGSQWEWFPVQRGWAVSLGWAQTLQGDRLHKSPRCKTDYLSVLANIFIVTCSEVCDSFQARKHFWGFLQVDSIGCNLQHCRFREIWLWSLSPSRNLTGLP